MSDDLGQLFKRAPHRPGATGTMSGSCRPSWRAGSNIQTVRIRQGLLQWFPLTNTTLLAFCPVVWTQKFTQRHGKMNAINHGNLNPMNEHERTNITPLPSVYLHPPATCISIHWMRGRGGQVVKVGDGKRCQEGLYIIIFD